MLREAENHQLPSLMCVIELHPVLDIAFHDEKEHLALRRRPLRKIRRQSHRNIWCLRTPLRGHRHGNVRYSSSIYW